MEIKFRKSKFKRLQTQEIETLSHFFPNGIVAIDLETTGLSPLTDKIIEVGAIKLKKEKISVFNTLVNPGIEIPNYSFKIHKISTEDTQGAPKFKKIENEILEFLENCTIVAHNAFYDIGFLTNNMKRENIPLNNVFDSLTFSRKSLKGTSHSLKSLSTFFSLNDFNHHVALDDAYLTLRVLSKLLKINNNLKDGLYGAWNKVFIPENQALRSEVKKLVPFFGTGEKVFIKYNGGSKHKNTWRPIAPIGLVKMPNGVTLVAKCLIDNSSKVFAMHRIKESKI